MKTFQQFVEENKYWDERTVDWLQRHRIQITPDGKRAIFYHGTSPQNAKAIKSSGFFKTNSFFTEDPKHAEYEGGRHGNKVVVLKVEIDPMQLWLGVHAQAKTNIPFIEAK